MGNYDYQYCLFGVGHGLFWAGKFFDFNIVYDCGSFDTPALDSAINNYHSNQIDLLVVSHFHSDHIKGFKTLFNEKRPCKTVFFPYVTPEELMFLQIDYALDLFNKKAKITNEDQDYFRFLDNPTEFLQEVTGAEKIIPIHPSESSDIPIDSTIDFNKLSNHQTLTDNINISYNNDRTNPPKSFMLRFFHFSHKDLPCIQNYISYLSSLGINSWKDVFDPQNESTVYLAP